VQILSIIMRKYVWGQTQSFLGVHKFFKLLVVALLGVTMF
jgi:hypothetical protein